MRTLLQLTCLVLVTCAVLAGPAPAHAEPWQPGPGSMGASTVEGAVDLPSGQAYRGAMPVRGWALDPTSGAVATAVQIYYGEINSGWQLATAETGLSRPDVAAAFNDPQLTYSGFEAWIDFTGWAVGTYALTAYAYVPNRGWWSSGFLLTVPRVRADAATRPRRADEGPPRSRVDAPVGPPSQDLAVPRSAVDPPGANVVPGYTWPAAPPDSQLEVTVDTISESPSGGLVEGRVCNQAVGWRAGTVRLQFGYEDQAGTRGVAPETTQMSQVSPGRCSSFSQRLSTSGPLSQAWIHYVSWTWQVP
jgi:hypothetical protein